MAVQECRAKAVGQRTLGAIKIGNRKSTWVQVPELGACISWPYLTPRVSRPTPETLEDAQITNMTSLPGVECEQGCEPRPASTQNIII